MRMVLASGASMLLMTLAAPLPRVAVSVQRFKEASTSDESILEPSWNVMPWRRGIVEIRPSAETSGILSASSGVRVHLASKV
ncbi:hypothetical protein G6F32_017196 [Rhizopus arrhizus]|nr:hypothetical protein G6F32_017196 [Rhizopus arrhizus]